MKVGRLGHEPRPTAPFTEEVVGRAPRGGRSRRRALAARGRRAHRGRRADVHVAPPRRRCRSGTRDALGADKWEQGLALADGAARAPRARAASLLHRSGKHYPGESLPRWALDIIGRRDGVPARERAAPTGRARAPSVADARALRSRRSPTRLGVDDDASCAAYEDPWHQLHEEARLPSASTRSAPTSTTPEERRRLARVLDRGLGDRGRASSCRSAPAPGGGWRARALAFRREHLYLVPGDSPDRPAPPARLARGAPPPLARGGGPRGPARPAPRATAEAEAKQGRRGSTTPRRTPAPRPGRHPHRAVRRAARRHGSSSSCPPLASAGRFCELVRTIDETAGGARPRRRPRGLSAADVARPAPASRSRPIPGVLEVNIPPTRTSREHVALLETVFDAALHAACTPRSTSSTGAQAGSGGGNHLTLGGPTALASPFVRGPICSPASSPSSSTTRRSRTCSRASSSARPRRRRASTRRATTRSTSSRSRSRARSSRGAGAAAAVARGRALPPPARRRLRQHPPRRDLHRQALRSRGRRTGGRGSSSCAPSRCRRTCAWRWRRSPSCARSWRRSRASRTARRSSAGGRRSTTASSCRPGCGATSRTCSRYLDARGLPLPARRVPRLPRAALPDRRARSQAATCASSCATPSSRGTSSARR